jgi:hypothetical protein
VLTKLLIPAALLLAVAGCTSTPAPTDQSLTATLVGGDNVNLSWHQASPAPAGEVVEYSNSGTGQFTPLDFAPPSQTTYAHDELIPDTAFYYKVVPYSGPTSNTVTVDLPPGAGTDDAGSWATPATAPGPAPHASVHTAAGAPTGLTATIEAANGIKLAWTDNDTDAAGYFVEVQPRGSKDFQVVQVLDPKINTCGIITSPGEKHVTIRVRAVYYGNPSNTVMQHTAAGAG